MRGFQPGIAMSKMGAKFIVEAPFLIMAAASLSLDQGPICCAISDRRAA